MLACQAGHGCHCRTKDSIYGLAQAVHHWVWWTTHSVPPVPVCCCVALQFARDIQHKIPQGTQEAIKETWQARRCMPITCGIAGKQQHAAIFTTDADGKPVVWVPSTPAAASQLEHVVAGGSSGCAPAGYVAMSPNEFEAEAGRGNTKNWQLSIELSGEDTRFLLEGLLVEF